MVSKSWFLRIAGLCGVVVPVVSLGLIFISIALSPWFSWHNNALSDLGVSSVALLFNLALIVGGLLDFVFSLGVSRWMGPGWLSRLGSAALIVGAIALTLIGVFTEDLLPVHVAVAATYFLLTPISYLLLGTAWLRRGEKVPGIQTIAAGIAALVAITLVPHPSPKGIAVPEILAAVLMCCWTFSTGVILLSQSANRQGGH